MPLRKPSPRQRTKGVLPIGQGLWVSFARRRFSIVGQVDLLQPAAAGEGAAPDDRLLLRVEETNHRLHPRRSADPFPFFDDAPAHTNPPPVVDGGRVPFR